MSSNIRLNSTLPVSTDAESFYRDYWQPHIETDVAGTGVRDRRDFVINNLIGAPVTGKTVLEIGVGGEGGIIAALQQGNTVYGVDVSDSALLGCRNLGIPAEKANCDRDPLPFSADTFDIVIALEVFEHFANPQFVAEQIRRVLKPAGFLILSTPAPYTYHWPRPFYPALFERINFQDFLLVNELMPTIYADPLFCNVLAGDSRVDDIDRSHSYYWKAINVGNDADRLYDIGKYLLERRDSLGFRIRPIEAIDILRKSIDAGCGSVAATRDYLCALLYRLVNGESEEFLSRVGCLIELVTVNPENHDYIGVLLDVHREAASLGKQFLDPELLVSLVNMIPKR